jgi:hypothetical protein
MNKTMSIFLTSKGDANKHINDFILYERTEKGEGEETLIDLFLDSVIDPKLNVTVTSCRLRNDITLQKFFEEVRKHDNVIAREHLADGKKPFKIRQNTTREAME